MKTLTLLFTIMFVVVTSSVFAQSTIGAGLKAGLNICNQIPTGEGENVETSPLYGFHIGGYGNYFILEPLAVQMELLFTQKGSNWSDPFFKGKDRLGYIDLPILIRYQIMEYLNVHAGPHLGFLVCAKQIPEDGDAMDAKDYYNSMDIALGFGIEGNLPHNINLTVRYILGLADATTESEYWEGWKNNVLQISLGYRLKGN